jgi:hypothetical protein
MKNQVETIDNLLNELSDKHTLLGKQGNSWNGILRTDIRASMIKLIEAKKLIEWIK